MDAQKGGSSLVDFQFKYSVETPNAPKDAVETPMLQLIDEQYPDEAELLHIKKVKITEAADEYVNLWILYENDNSGILKALSDSKTVNCCMETTSWKSYFGGIARVFSYVQKDKEFVAPIDQLNLMYEGGLK